MTNFFVRKKTPQNPKAIAALQIGLFKTEVINHMGPWKSRAKLEWETCKWIDWYNNKRLHSALNYLTPKQIEENYFENLNHRALAA